ncbi:phenylacetate--CoA ligase family protein [Brevibacillus massiliensis]|uniref:phenylacetate--CoA ligase family protein n=2 Tax=Brevibacillus massiliensis TaxID=1118054 RepID=UPI0011CAC285|nr:phenylacetate--CoA ligase family protein [Brevibacillus massiliensis]
MEMQRENLTSLLKHACRNVPYYRTVLKESGVIDRQEQVQLEHFSRIPLLDKNVMRTQFEQLQSADIHTRMWYENTSGGSTGEPVRFLQDKEYFFWNEAIKIVNDEWTDRSLVDRQIRLWGSARDLFAGKESAKTQLGRWLRNELWLYSLRMTAEQMTNYVNQINQYKPMQILAYAESIYELARFIEREKMPVYSPTAIMTSAGTLYPRMREVIERVFQTRCFNCYGSREVGDVACECNQHKGLHVSSATHYVEILRPDGTATEPGELGELVITVLFNYSMPFIRYRIGDVGSWSEHTCSCRRGLPLLKEVAGRVTDMFLDKQGVQIDGSMFNLLLDDKPFVKKYQVIQEEYEKIRILIVPVDQNRNPFTYHKEELDDVTKKIQMVMGETCQVTFELMEEILPASSGKYRYTISKVSR